MWFRDGVMMKLKKSVERQMREEGDSTKEIET